MYLNVKIDDNRFKKKDKKAQRAEWTPPKLMNKNYRVYKITKY